MKLAASLLALLVAGVVFGIEMSPARMNAQETKADAKEVKWQGKVLHVMENESALTIRSAQSAASKETLKIAYSNSTEWTKENKKGDKADVKEGSFIIAVGKVDDKGVLQATRIDLRKPR